MLGISVYSCDQSVITYVYGMRTTGNDIWLLAFTRSRCSLVEQADGCLTRSRKYNEAVKCSRGIRPS